MARESSLFESRDKLLEEKLESLPILEKDRNEIKNWNLKKDDIEAFAKFGLSMHRKLLEGNSVDDLKKSYVFNPYLNSELPNFLKERDDKFEKTFQLFSKFENKKRDYIQKIMFFDDKFSDLRKHINKNRNDAAYEKANEFFFKRDYFKPIKAEIFGKERGFQKGKIGEFLFYARIKPEELQNIGNVKKNRLSKEKIKKAFQKIETILSAK